MATIKLGNSKSCSRCINYAEKRAVVVNGVNCDTDFAKSQMKQVRVAYCKDSDVQAHTIIQSFSPHDDVSPELANEIGCALASKIAPGFQVAVYTHTDKDHTHNHIIINSVSIETGKKYHSDNNQIGKIRQISDALCVDHGLSVVVKPANLRYTLAEQNIIASGKASWKDEIRQVIDAEKAYSESYDEFKQNVIKKYGIEIDDTRKYITFKHPDNGRVVRGKTLGADYEKEGIIYGISRQNERQQSGVGQIERTGGAGEEGFREPSAEGSISQIERELREITGGVQQLTSDGRREQAERERRADRARERTERNRAEPENTERNDDRAGKRADDGLER